MLINEQIRAREVRLIGKEGEQVGVIPLTEAQAMANEAELDLVLIAPQAKPPVCKIIDYSKFKFEEKKRLKENKKNQKVTIIKEVRFTLNISDHDFNFKTNNAIRFLEHGDKVKATVRFRGREITHSDLGMKILTKFIDAVAEYGTPDKPPKMEGRNLAVMINAGVKK
ncbi:MAG: translation initiation factor IF-3 [Clostridiales bacterium]|jgi:translation initiation factor IF-3|nr:translation initiation factor IF-3 [Clostridiales bacterium]